MPRPPKSEGATALAYGAPDAIASARSAVQLAEATHGEAQAKVHQLRARADDLALQIVRQRVFVTGAGDAMAADPSQETRDAFAEATSRLESLEAQEKALRERLIPTAETAAEMAGSAVGPAEEGLTAALFRDAVRTKLIPADARFVRAVAELEAALVGCEAVRAEIYAEAAFRPFHVREIGYGQQERLLELRLLGMALPFDVHRFLHLVGDLPSTTRETPITDIIAQHERVFGLNGEA